MKKLTRRGAAVATALVVAVGGAGAAWAWQITSGSGTTSAQATAIQNLTIHGGPSPSTGLYPTGAVALVVTVENGNSFPVKINNVSVDRGSITADGAHAGNGCTWAPASHTVWTTAISYIPPGPNNTVPPHGQLVLTFPNAVTMAANAPTACAGAEFTIPVDATGQTI